MHPRRLLLLLCLVLATSLQGQDTMLLKQLGVNVCRKNQRASIDLSGQTAFAFAPDGKYWVVSNYGLAYFSNDFESEWHSATQVCQREPYNGFVEHKLFFFSPDTALLTPGTWDPTNYYYLTVDGGRTWSKRDFGESTAIRYGCLDDQKRLWLASRKSTIYYSEDRGQTFQTLHLPVEDTTLCLTFIDMKDGRFGLTGSHDHFDGQTLLFTDDNWASVRRIPSPQNKEHLTQIDKALIWKDFWIVRIHNEVFYTSSAKVEWNHFPLNIVDFFLDHESGNLIAVTDDLQVRIFTSPTEYRLFCEEPLPARPVETTMRNGILYVYARDRILCKADSTHVDYVSDYYTYEKKIDPRVVIEGEKILWGIDDGVLYVAGKQDREWYRHFRFQKDVSDITLLNDTVAMFWDGERHYTCTLRDGKTEPYTLKEPLHDFLSSPIQSVIINSGYFVYRQDTLRLTANSDSTLRASHALLTHFYRKHHYDEEPYRIKRQRIRVKKEVNSRELRDILADIDRRPERMPAITEFHITRADKEQFADRVKKADYTDLMNDLIHSDIPIEIFVEALLYFKEFYLSVSEHIDTLGTETMSNILYKDDRWFSTGGADWFEVQITNENGDSLLFSNVYYNGNYAWFLPWSVTYNGIHFRCYLPALSQWVNDIIPKKFYGKEWFDNASFLMQSAHCLWMESLKKR